MGLRVEPAMTGYSAQTRSMTSAATAAAASAAMTAASVFVLHILAYKQWRVNLIDI